MTKNTVKCPDCMGGVEMDLITEGITYHGGIECDVELCEEDYYYKCPKCRGEYWKEDLE